MAIMAWNDDYSVKVGKWDTHHKKIIDAINKLHDAMAVGKGKEALERNFKWPGQLCQISFRFRRGGNGET